MLKNQNIRRGNPEIFMEALVIFCAMFIKTGVCETRRRRAPALRAPHGHGHGQKMRSL